MGATPMLRYQAPDNMSALNETVIVAFGKGYRVQPDGSVISPSGNIRLLSDKGGYLNFTIKLSKPRRNGTVLCGACAGHRWI